MRELRTPRRSVCGEAAARYVAERMSHLTKEQRAAQFAEFNERLTELIAAGRLAG